MPVSIPVYSPPKTKLDVLYEDAWLLAINKPSGLLSVPGRGPDKADCLSARVQQTYPEARVVHRLDMETSGILLFARDPATQRAIGRLLEKRRIAKTYLAVVRGRTQADSGEINAPLSADWPRRPRQKIDYENGRPSRTRYRLVSYDSSTDRSRLLLSPITGRSHQLRVHLMSVGHPILGDPLYGPLEADRSATRLMLHATALEFEHPATGDILAISSPAPF